MALSYTSFFQERNHDRKMGIRSGEREHTLELITKLVYSQSDSAYIENYQQLLQSGLSSVISYFNDNWHDI